MLRQGVTRSELAVTWLGHATTRIALDGLVFLTDPVLGRWVGPLRRSGPLPQPASYSGVDVVLISHAHHDHLDLPSLRRLAPSVTVVAPAGLGSVIRRSGLANVAELGVGETLTFGSVTVTASPAVHPVRSLPFLATVLEKMFLLGMISVIFAHVLDVSWSNSQIVAGVAVFVVVNAVISQYLARRGTHWRHTALQFLTMAAINSGMVLIIGGQPAPASRFQAAERDLLCPLAEPADHVLRLLPEHARTPGWTATGPATKSNGRSRG